MTFEIRDVADLPDLAACEELQRLVWRFSPKDIVTSAMLSNCRRSGGVVLGAFDGSGRMQGFVFSLPALFGSRTIQHSHMLAVREESRDSGIGYHLKKAQWEKARELGNPLITWTFDPLESRNAYLNICKLGVEIRRYYVNLYGESTSSHLHAGLGTDRFLAEWWVEPRGRRPGPVPGEVQEVVWAHGAASGPPVPCEPMLDASSARVRIGIPRKIQELKQQEPQLAMAWRKATRAAFVEYLNRGYEVVSFGSDPGTGLSYYDLEKTPHDQQ